ncbi:ParB/RepB/Spo0J family partition protein [Vibrio owensii]|uniref:ParB/RepB/Spo0J family partition protein n=1 Tax=Vibrio owensii TaxID=696485 RepID=UPI0018F25F31|nr:ParB/RepB/Spo0J family partition protein [Vibrio owensii]
MGAIIEHEVQTDAVHGLTKKILGTIKRGKIHLASWENQRKRKRNPTKFAEMTADVKERGFDTPLQVRPHPTIKGDFELLAGYGRFEIANILGIEDIPVMIHTQCDRTQAKIIMSAENMQREDLHPIDAANAAASMLAELGGDMEALESATNWNQTRLKRYFQLLRCTEKVQSLIDNKQESGFTLTLGHANELSALPNEMQDKIVDSILAKKMSVKDLRSFIKTSLERNIDEAIFDKADCNGCKYNKVSQTDLFFENTNTGAMCTNVHCFKEKTQAHLDSRLEALKVDHGNVIFMSTASNNVTPVSALVVGKKKYTNDCLSCTKFTAILVDEGTEIDTVRESYCMDIACAKIKDTQRKTSTTKNIAEKEAEDALEADKKPRKKAATKTQTKTGEATTTEKEKPEEETKVTSGVVNDARDFLQAEFAPKLTQHPTFNFALMLYSLQKLRGEHGLNHETIIQSMTETPEKLSEMVHEEIAFIINQTKGDNAFNGQALAILAGNTMPEAVKEAKRAWKPTKANLESMRLAVIKQLLEKSGFKKSFIERFDDKAYEKLVGMKKADQIKVILDIEFDWTDFCPVFVEQFLK